jgi:hypothetical protein
MAEPTCPKCRATMERGFLVDNSYGAVAEPQWAEGPVEKSFWTGVKMHGRERRRVETYRCQSCGYLESYAREVTK